MNKNFDTYYRILQFKDEFFLNCRHQWKLTSLHSFTREIKLKILKKTNIPISVSSLCIAFKLSISGNLGSPSFCKCSRTINAQISTPAQFPPWQFSPRTIAPQKLPPQITTTKYNCPQTITPPTEKILLTTIQMIFFWEILTFQLKLLQPEVLIFPNHPCQTTISFQMI